MGTKIFTISLCVFFISSIVPAVTIDWVTVGNPGNANDEHGHGSVSEVYRISTYEVTAGQYTEFLNAVAASDPHGLYNIYMWSSEYGCKIQRNGSENSYSYSVASDRANRPVNYVSWYDCLRFTNWLHNGQGSGDTEDGAYDMSLGDNVIRKSSAEVWLPENNEWIKAAYHKNDGVTGNYFSYPTSSDIAPSNDLINPDPGNNATFYDGGDPMHPTPAGFTIGSPYWFTEVGAHENSKSPYGTFDMGGNVWEWKEEVNMRGGSFGSNVSALRSNSFMFAGPGYENNDVGFRVASIPEPITILFLGLGGMFLRRKCKS